MIILFCWRYNLDVRSFHVRPTVFELSPLENRSSVQISRTCSRQNSTENKFVCAVRFGKKVCSVDAWWNCENVPSLCGLRDECSSDPSEASQISHHHNRDHHLTPPPPLLTKLTKVFSFLPFPDAISSFLNLWLMAFLLLSLFSTTCSHCTLQEAATFS